MTVRLEVEGDVATLILDRAPKRNALDEAMLSGILEAAEEAGRQPVQVVVVRSSSLAFSAGADLNEWAEISSERAAELSRLGNRAFDAMAGLPVPSVAVIEGAAIGGGLELALACDLRVASTEARFALPEIRLGNLPSWGGIPRLVEAVGPAQARGLLLTGELIDGEQAVRIGLVYAVESPDGLGGVVQRVLDGIRTGDRSALGLAKTRLRAGADAELEAALASYTATLEASRQRKLEFLAGRAGSASR